MDIFDSTNGEIVIDGSALYPSQSASADQAEVKLTADPDQIWAANAYAGNHTPVEAARMEDGSLGVLTVEKLRLSVNVFESPDQMEAMTKGAAH